MPSVSEVKVCSKCNQRKPAEAFFVKVQRTGRRMAHGKDCHNAHTLAHYYAGGEGMRKYRREKRRQYYAADPERHLEVGKKSRLRNLERIREGYRKYDAANKEKRAAYREANRERRAAYNSAWKKANKDKVNAQNHQRRVRLQAAGRCYTAAEWQARKAKFNFRCLMCGRREPEIKLCVDHVIPLSAGGSNRIDNIQCLGKSCNGKKHTKVLDLRVAPWPKRRVSGSWSSTA